MIEEELHAAAKLLRDLKCESVVIHFLHAYANPAHEMRALEILREIWPNDYVTAGHQLLSEYREYERGVTASVNAAVRPILHRYIDRLQNELNSKGFARDFLVMNGNGGMVSARLVDKESAKTVMSGPASGVMAAANAAKRANIENPQSVFGLSDGGAHCGVLVDAGVSTYMLSYFARDRKRGPLMSLPFVVHKLTQDSARMYGLNDRGVIAPGYKADLNLIDFDKLRLEPPQMMYDLPAGGKRLIQKAKGYLWTMCAGEITYADGKHTGAMPGRLLRGAPDQLN